jgi:myo-inositol-1(or 4)-monophosphatase
MAFATGFATQAGRFIREMRTDHLRTRIKLDRTVVTDADERVNRWFIEAVRRRSVGQDAVLGEEMSAGQITQSRVWTIDPVDGTGEYVDLTIPYYKLTCCIGISLLVGGVPTLAVVYNPFRGELFTAMHDSPALCNGYPLVCSSRKLARGVPYDYSYWDGAAFDARKLDQWLGAPLGVYSAIYQACMVASGRSALAFFPGSTIHDVAPGALLVARAGGQVTDVHGNPLQWDSLTRGVVYASKASHAQALSLLSC